MITINVFFFFFRESDLYGDEEGEDGDEGKHLETLGKYFLH